MRAFITLLVLAAIAVAIVGYDRGWYTVGSTSSDEHSQYSVTVDNQKWQQDRDKFCRKAQTWIEELNGKIDDLQARVTTVETENRDKVVREIADLRQREQALKEQLHEAQNATPESWQALHAKLSKALNDLQEGFSHAWSHLHDK